MALLTTALAMLRVRWQMRSAHVHLADEQEDLRFCYDTLENVSRSFAVVISQLSDEPLRNGICIFYLVLRALDTIEDDMSVAVPVKLEELPKFHTHLDDPTWCMTGVGEGKERELLEHFPCVSRAYQQLKEDYQDIIADICKKMADGMCDFLTRPVETKADYDLYCHYVAGLVGHGLTRLFANCGFEDPHLADDLTAANHMGLFLQKTNIIRDYYEDILEQPPRVFWPKDIWGKYAANIKDFMDVSNKEAAMRCLNAMVLDAIQHIPYVISYMASLRDPSVFRFCAIPQVMAIATLTSVYNNPKTFHEKVKIAKGEACYIMVESTDLYHALRMFSSYCERLLAKLDAADPSTQELRRELKASMSTMESYMRVKAPQRYLQTLLARYPGLGGGFIMSIVDSITNLFRGSAALPYSPSDLPPVTLSAKSTVFLADQLRLHQKLKQHDSELTAAPPLRLGVVQTAYANAASTRYLRHCLNNADSIVCTLTGVKHLHKAAQDFDFGVYFEANGHGTVVLSERAQDYVSSLREDDPLRLFVSMVNTAVGDAITDILLVEYVLAVRGLSLAQWFALYTDLPSRQLKVVIADRSIIRTTDADRRATHPPDLQDAIDALVDEANMATVTTGLVEAEGGEAVSRAFVRPSGTENIVRVYAESATQPLADWLAASVALLVHRRVGGVGPEPPSPGRIPV